MVRSSMQAPGPLADSLQVHISNALIVFQVCTGAKSEDQARTAARKVCRSNLQWHIGVLTFISMVSLWPCPQPIFDGLLKLCLRSIAAVCKNYPEGWVSSDIQGLQSAEHRGVLRRQISNSIGGLSVWARTVRKRTSPWVLLLVFLLRCLPCNRGTCRHRSCLMLATDLHGLL
jgi:hypothetical protein